MAGDTPPGATASDTQKPRQHSADKSERLQILLAVLLGTAALATAWAAYRGELYSGDSLILLNRSAQTSDRASQEFSAAQTVFAQDVTLYTTYAIELDRPGDEKAGNSAYIYDDLMRPAMVKMIDWYDETGDEITSPFVKQNPFFVPPSEDKEGVKLRAAAAKDFKEARRLDDTGDKYVLYTVLFAAALFLYGIASVASSRKVLVTSMAMGALLFLFGLVQMISTTSGAPKLL